MDPTIYKAQSLWYNINQLVELSENLNSLQSRLLSTLNLVKHILECEKEEDYYNWEFNPSDFKIKESDKCVALSEEMKLTMQIFPSKMEHDENIKCDIEMERKRQIMAVITYMILFSSNPYFGKGYYDKVVISHEWEKNYFGKDRIFAYSEDSRNRPDSYYQSRTINRWRVLKNSALFNLLIDCFKEDSRVTPFDIISTLYKSISQLNTSGSDLKRNLIDPETEASYLLWDGKYLVDTEYDIIGKVVEKVENKRRDLYLSNLSKSSWEVTTATGKRLDIKPGDEMPVRAKMCIAIPKHAILWNVE